MTIRLENKTLEDELIDLSKKLKIKAEDLVENFLIQQINQIKKSKVLKYEQQDPLINIKELNDTIEDKILTNPFENIDNVKEYSKELRENSWR